MINPADILYASTEKGRACLHTAGGQIPTHFTLAELEKRLARSGFFRAHRGYLVNLQRVKAVIPYTRDSFTLVLDDSASTEIPFLVGLKWAFPYTMGGVPTLDEWLHKAVHELLVSSATVPL